MSLEEPEISSYLSEVKRIQVKAKKAVEELLAGAYRSVFKGTGIDFDDLREFYPGDDIRSINWNATARMGRPFIKTFREERNLTVQLLVDVSGSTLFGSGEDSKKNRALELASAIGFSAIESNDRVGLILFSDKVIKYLPARRGIRHGLRLIRELLHSQSAFHGTCLQVALDFLGKIQKRRCICFVISDFFTEHFAQSLAPLALKHDVILVRLTDPMEQSLPQMGLVYLKDLETAQVELINLDENLVRAFSKRAQDMHKLFHHISCRLKVRSLEVSTFQRAEDALYRFFSHRRGNTL